MDEALIRELAAVVGEGSLVTDPGEMSSYGLDWTRFHEPAPSAVVLVRDIEQVQALVRFAISRRLALVPSGGRTGQSGGAVAANGEVVVAFDRMNRILGFEPEEDLVTVEPGVVTASLQQFAREHGRYYPVEFASSGSSQLGGNIATNAGGIKVLRYGLTRERVMGLRVVTGTGELLNLNRGLVKNATGYDLRHLMIGSEGTLGLIVEATLSLIRPPAPLTVMLLAVPDMGSVMQVLTRFREAMALTAFEFFSHNGLAHVLARHELSAPFASASPYYVLLEFEELESTGDEATAAFAACSAEGLVSDGVVSQSEQDRASLWRYRESISESITPRVPYKNDVSVRVAQVPAFLEAVEEVVTRRYPDFEIVWFGHIGDGNLHLNILKPADVETAQFKAKCEQVSEEVLGVVQQFGGSISAEHGVGLLKRDQLRFSRSTEEIELMRGIKQLFDPHGILNPGKLIPPS